jgi:hypothetical protein
VRDFSLGISIATSRSLYDDIILCFLKFGWARDPNSFAPKKIRARNPNFFFFPSNGRSLALSSCSLLSACSLLCQRSNSSRIDGSTTLPQLLLLRILPLPCRHSRPLLPKHPQSQLSRKKMVRSEIHFSDKEGVVCILLVSLNPTFCFSCLCFFSSCLKFANGQVELQTPCSKILLSSL